MHTRRHVLKCAAAVGLLLNSSLRAGTPAVRTGYQKGGGLLNVLTAQGILEKTLLPRGWAVTWAEFPAGPQLLEAMNAGSVDFGYTGAPPPIFAQAVGNDLVYAGAEPVGITTEAIVVKQGSSVAGVPDLVGKSVAVQKGSSAHYLLFAALEKAGLSFTDIEPVYLVPAFARAAFESDRVDAWAIWDPYLAGIQSATRVRVIANYGNLPETFAFYLARRPFSDHASDALSLLLDQLAAVGAWAVANPHAAAEVLAPQVGLPVAVAEVWQRRARYGVKPIDAAVISAQQKIADVLFQHHLIQKHIDIAAAVWHRPT